jgi:predicted HicB family RNase H-like nuclease
VIDFFGKDVAELKREFRISIEEYVDYCRQKGLKPEKSWSGKLTLRPTEEQRRRFAVAAALANKSVNVWMTDVLDQASRRAEESVIPVV